MNMRLVFLGFLSVIIAFYLKVQADGFGFPDGQLTDLERAKLPINYVFSIISGLFGLILFFLAWRPLKIKQAIVSQAATAVYILIILIFFAVNYWLGITYDNGVGA